MSAHLLVLGEMLAKSNESQKSGPIGLAVILVLCVAAYFLFKSMSKHLKHVREDFPSDGVNDLDARLPEPSDPKILPADEARSASGVEQRDDRPPAPEA